jgi:hypothetical protein
LYPSAQAAGEKKNIVLFHHASRVRSLEFPPDTEFEARTYTTTEDGREPDYWVSEEVPEPEPEPEKDDKFSLLSFEPSQAGVTGDADIREITLNLDLESVQVHHIEAVSFKTTAHSVRRHRWKKGDLKF